MTELGIVLFTSTKGHFGRKDIYKITVQKLKEQWKNVNIKFRYFAHIKTSQGEADTFNEMHSWLSDQGFKVASTDGAWSHGNNTHATEYTKDIIKSFSHPYVQQSQYSLWLEDDWILNGNPISFLSLGLKALRNDPDILCVRSNFGLKFNKETCFRNKTTDGVYHQKENYTPYGPTFTFQPTLVRTRDVYQAYRIVRNEWAKLKNQHIELTSGMAMRALSDSATPFCFIDPRICNSIHIGAEPFEKILEES